MSRKTKPTSAPHGGCSKKIRNRVLLLVKITTDSIPYQSPAAKQQARIVGGVLKQRDTFVVPVGE